MKTQLDRHRHWRLPPHTVYSDSKLAHQNSCKTPDRKPQVVNSQTMAATVQGWRVRGSLRYAIPSIGMYVFKVFSQVLTAYLIQKAINRLTVFICGPLFALSYSALTAAFSEAPAVRALTHSHPLHSHFCLQTRLMHPQ